MLCVRLVRGAACACIVSGCVSARHADDGGLSDPQSPAAMENHLAAAERLAAGGPSSCQERLEEAGSQLAALTSGPAFAIVMPQGAARLAALEYRLHSARASCVSDAAQREGELREAQAQAREAVAGFREGLDYQDMVIMQYNLAVTLHTLGDSAASVSELEAAIGMDREYGFDEDAQENGQLLRHWQDPQAPQADPGAAPPQLSQQTAVLKFAWAPADAQVQLATALTVWTPGKPVRRTSASRTVRRHVRRESGGGWIVSYGGGDIVQGEMPDFPEGEGLGTVALSEIRGLMELPAVRISPRGEFLRLSEVVPYAQQLHSAALGLIRVLSGGREPSEADSRDLQRLLSVGSLTNLAEEDYNMQTGAWYGAALEQGRWYPISLPLVMPGIGPGSDVMQRMQFAFTRRVPCLEGEPPRCVEIVVHAHPDPHALAQTENMFSRWLRLHEPMQYWSATYMRLVVDPDTLTPYVRDVRRYWYVRCGAQPVTVITTDASCGSGVGSDRTLWQALGAPSPVPSPRAAQADAPGPAVP
jgi:hypothetical protein